MNGMIGRMKTLKRGGFSLLELLVVIFILMILIGWLTPNFSKFLLRVKLQNSTREVTTIFRRAARNAMTMRRSINVQVFTYDSTASDKNVLRALIDTNIRTSIDTWEQMSEGYCAMINPVNIIACNGTGTWQGGASSPTNTTYGFRYYSSSASGTVWVTYLQSGEPGWLAGAPASDDTSRVEYNTVTLQGNQRARHYTYLHAP